jgi:hypothetical protein
MSAAILAISGWVRYAGTASQLSPQGAYVLLFIGQVHLILGVDNAPT